MSTLNVSNITDGTTTVGTSYVVNGSAKAWYHLDNDYTTSLNPNTGNLSIQDSLNTSSVTDNGTGDYTMSWLNSFSNGFYSIVQQGQYISDATTYEYGFMEGIIGAPTTSQYTFHWRYYSSSYYDPAKWWAAAHGDLA